MIVFMSTFTILMRRITLVYSLLKTLQRHVLSAYSGYIGKAVEMPVEKYPWQANR
jgi:hypothetical protein